MVEAAELVTAHPASAHSSCWSQRPAPHPPEDGKCLTTSDDGGLLTRMTSSSGYSSWAVTTPTFADHGTAEPTRWTRME